MDTIAIVGDAHANSTIGLCTRTVHLDEGGQYHANDTQKWLWDCWLDYVDTVKAQKGEVTAFLNGDWCDADSKKRSHQIISRNPSVIQSIAFDVAEPLVDIAERVIVIRGTDAHVGKSGWYEEELARDLTNNVPDPTCDNHSWQEFYGEFSGIVFDIKHHGQLGRLPWTRTNSLHRLAYRLVLAYTERKERLPNIALRNHNHKYGDTGDNDPIRCISNYAWQAKTEYATRVSDEPSDVGGIIINCDGGQYEIIKKHYPLKPRRVWTIQQKTFTETLKNTLGMK